MILSRDGIGGEIEGVVSYFGDPMYCGSAGNALDTADITKLFGYVQATKLSLDLSIHPSVVLWGVYVTQEWDWGTIQVP